ncbi:SPARC-like protein 1 [Neosynchiropus ocellatus]
MRVNLALVCFLAATLSFSVGNKAHGKHHGSHKTSQMAKEMAMVPDDVNAGQVLATFESSSPEEDDLSSEDRLDAVEDDGGTGTRKSTAVLLSEEQLVSLLKKETEEEERRAPDDAKVEKKHGAKRRKLKKVHEKNRALDKVEKMIPEDKLESEHGVILEEGSADLDYNADSAVPEPLHRVMRPQSESPDVAEEKTKSARDEVKMSEAADSEDKHLHTSELQTKPEDRAEPLRDSQEPNNGTDLESVAPQNGTKENKPDGKTRRQRKNQRTRKHLPQRDEPRSGGKQNQPEPQESIDSAADPTAQKAKRRRAGKWGPVVGMNPVQIRATADLYPSSVSSPHSDAPADPCDSFRCKRGKTCKLDAENKPSCVCRQPSECPSSVSQLDHVCGTDNKTYDTSCELFATKCNLEGTKRGHKLHMDYIGSCKIIPPCVDSELVQFPLRMRDWLKNVLLQLYEHDSVTPGFLTSKQRFRVKKIFESERRLHAGDHSVELLARDFEKNYNMYIYPVHWQFAQLDQHPSDRFLSHSELAPLRVPLVPMEHCTSRFFQECDADKDKQVSIKEWTSCFGIRNEDVDLNLLF